MYEAVFHHAIRPAAQAYIASGSLSSTRTRFRRMMN